MNHGFRLYSFLIILVSTACSVTAVRPAQEMSYMEVAIRSAKEVGADNLSPDLFRNSMEYSLKARKEYRLKNFQAAKEHAEKARDFAEKAEFDSIRNGGKRETIPHDPLSEPSYAPEPTGTPADPESQKPNAPIPPR